MNAPRSIGRYDVEGLLGQGGMGRVYLARDTVLGRRVAIKVLRDDLGIPPETRDALFLRMRNEARAAASLSHPHMVTLHDMGEEAAVGLFLVFEYVEGDTLRDRIAEGGLTVREVAKLARDLGSALDAAHAVGVIHRDVKPENVILAPLPVRSPSRVKIEMIPNGGAFQAKLTDFGIARLPDSTITRAGSILGTPAYSAPEALALGEFSARSDQFSLASTLYESITGRRAFPGEDALAVASRVATEAPTPLHQIDPPILVDVRTIARIELIFGRALAKNPKERFESCSDFCDALATALLASNDIFTPAITPARLSLSLSPRARKTQNFVAAAGVLTIVLLIVLGRNSRDARIAGDGASMHDVADSFASASLPSHAPWIKHEPRPSSFNHERERAPRDAGESERDASSVAPPSSSAVLAPLPSASASPTPANSRLSSHDAGL